ncbi:MAG: hypothetical protein GXP19_01860 [Gammaproteobacteria bacterium]|nr:hypothetical protein [Gammaproteobacteria bacterium]
MPFPTKHQKKPFRYSPLTSKDYTNIYTYAGAYSGTDDRKGIDIKNISVGASYYMTDGLGLYAELMVLTSRGKLNGLDADTEGLGGFFALRWHFLRSNNWSAFFNHGIGWVTFNDDFPPGGTTLNALLQYGFGMTARVNQSIKLQFGVRAIYISNGRGLVDDNPSYDGQGVYLGIER